MKLVFGGKFAEGIRTHVVDFHIIHWNVPQIADAIAAGITCDAVRGKCLFEVGSLRDLHIGRAVPVNIGDNRESVLQSEPADFTHGVDDALGAGNVQLAPWVHEIVLRVNIPEYGACCHNLLPFGMIKVLNGGGTCKRLFKKKARRGIINKTIENY